MNGGHFKLGLFVTVAGGLLVSFLLTLGALDRFEQGFFEVAPHVVEIDLPGEYAHIVGGRSNHFEVTLEGRLL